MPRVPVARQGPINVNIPSPTGAGSAINTAPGAGEGVGQLGQQIGELGNRLFEQAMAEKKVKLESEARQKLAQAREQSLQGPDFREAPQNYEVQANQVIEETVEQAPFAIQSDLKQQLTRSAAIDRAKLRRDAVQKSQEEQIQSTQNLIRDLEQQFAQAENPQERRVIQQNIQEKTQDLSASGAMLPSEAEALETQADLNAQRARAEQLIADKRPGEARAFVQDSTLPASDKRQLLSMAETQTGQNSAEYDKYVNDIEDHVVEFGNFPKSISGIPTPDIEKNLQGTRSGAELDFWKNTVTPRVQEFKKLTLPEQRRQLNEFSGEDVQTGRGAQLREALAASMQRTKEAAEDRPFQYAEQNRIIGKVRDLPVRDVLAGNTDTDAVKNILSERAAQAETLTRYYGRDVSPLKSEETELVSEVADRDADLGTRLFQSIGEGLGFARSQELANQISEDDQALGVAMMVAPEAPRVTREILSARQVDQSQVEFPEQQAIADEMFGQALQGSPRSRQAFVAAANAMYARKAASQGFANQPQEDQYRKALRKAAFGKPAQDGSVVGGPVRVNGTKTLPPKPGVDEQTTRQLFNGFSDPEAASAFTDPNRGLVNGRPGRQSPDGTLVRMDPTGLANAQPVYVGAGKYMFKMPDGGMVHALSQKGEPTGRPLVFDGEKALSTDTMQGLDVTVSPALENFGAEPGPL